MFDSGVLFEENKLSDTVVEFKITSKNKLHPFYVVSLAVLVALSIWGMAVRCIIVAFFSIQADSCLYCG